MVSMMVSSSVGSAGAASQAAGLAKMRQSMRAPGSSGENSAARPGDSVELSANAKAQATANAPANATANAVAKSTAQADTDIRHDKVTQMQVKIASGKYDKLSEAMLDKVATGLLRDLGLQG